MSRSRAVPATGFTIIELMIAMMVFSIILVVITAGVMQFTRQYYKGVIAGSTQNAARTIIDDATRAIQFNAGSLSELTSTTSGPAGQTVGYCIGESKRYSFTRSWQVRQSAPDSALHQSRFGLVADTAAGCSVSTTAHDTKTLTSLPAGGREMLGERMRVNTFTIDQVTGSPGLYTVAVRVVYGDDDLLCSPTVSVGGCTPTPPSGSGALTPAELTAPDLRCRSVDGSQFCAVSELSTTVKKRVQ